MESPSKEDTRNRSDLFRLLVKSVKDYAIFLLDPDGRVMTWNEGAERIKGYQASEIIGKHYSAFFPVEDVQEGKPARALRTAATEGRWVDEGWRVRCDGTRFWASAVLTALYEDGTLVGYAKVTRDLTERMRAETERLHLLEKERAARAETERALERLRAIQRVTEAALAHVSLDGLLTDLLDQVTDLLKLESAAILLVEGPEGELTVRASKGSAGYLSSGIRIPMGTQLEGRVAAERRPATLHDTSTTLSPSESSILAVPLMVTGRVIGVLRVASRRPRQFLPDDVQFLQIIGDRVALAIDHARLIESEMRARRDAGVASETLRARDEFLSVAAHELKTPMTGLRLAAQILMRRAPEDIGEEERKPFQVIETQIQRLNRIVNQILDTTRHRSGTLELRRTPANLTMLVEKVVRDARHRTDLHDIALTALSNTQAHVDAPKLEQVFSHLLDNALKFSPAGGQIDVSMDRTGEHTVCVSIRDRGIGVPVEHRPHLFERFYQAHAADYRSGIGIGLYLCKEIVALHGGSIRAEFPEDGGTRVTVEIPAGLTKQVA